MSEIRTNHGSKGVANNRNYISSVGSDNINRSSSRMSHQAAIQQNARAEGEEDVQICTNGLVLLSMVLLSYFSAKTNVIFQ